MNFLQPVFADVAYFALLIPITALMIPIVAILSHHQRKMAELIHRGGGPEQTHLIANLQREIHELRQMVHQHAVALDDLGMKPLQPSHPAPPPPPSFPGGY